VQGLLNVIDDTGFEFLGVIAEEKDAGSRLLDDRLVPRSDSTRQVAYEKADYACLVVGRDRACLLPKVARLVTCLTIGDPLPEHEVPTAEDTPAENAQAEAVDS